MIINVGMIDFSNELNNQSEILIMVHVDGLGLHDMRDMAANFRSWLNAEYSTTGKSISCNIFAILTMISLFLQGEVT